MTKLRRITLFTSVVVGLVAAFFSVASPASADTQTRHLLAATGVGCLSAKDTGSRPRAYAPDCNDGPYQQWRETTLSAGWDAVILANEKFDKCLAYGSTTSGIVLKPCDTRDLYQRWDRIFINDDIDGSSGIVYRSQASDRCLRAPVDTNGFLVSTDKCDPNENSDPRIRWIRIR